MWNMRVSVAQIVVGALEAAWIGLDGRKNKTVHDTLSYIKNASLEYFVFSYFTFTFTHFLHESYMCSITDIVYTFILSYMCSITDIVYTSILNL